MSGLLFDDLPVTPRREPDWFVAHRREGDNRAVAWVHSATGQEVRHCGHPTALRPYYVNGYLNQLGTFRLLEDAKAAAVRLGCYRMGAA